MTLTRVGHGAGSRDYPERPNVVRAMLGPSAIAPRHAPEVVVVEFTVDDATPQVLAYAVERIFAAGALDVHATPVHMKKGRIGQQITALSRPERFDAVARAALTETTHARPEVPSREARRARRARPKRVATPYGKIRDQDRKAGRRGGPRDPRVRRLRGRSAQAPRAPAHGAAGRSGAARRGAAEDAAMSRRPFYVTTPIYYVNDEPHIGHTYTTVVADTVARYRRATGWDVRFLTGTDEHGQKIERAARQLGIEPIALADRVVSRYRELWKRLAISHDDFIRTTEPRHRAGVHAPPRADDRGGRRLPRLVRRHVLRGVRGVLPGIADRRREVPRSRASGRGGPRGVVFLPALEIPGAAAPLDRRASRRDPSALAKERGPRVRRLGPQGSFDLAHDDPVGDPLADGSRARRVRLGGRADQLHERLGFGERRTTRLFTRYWPAQLHLVGKDIVRFHAVYWPAFLMSAGLPLPECVFAHGWWLKDEAKMSKSLRNVVAPEPLLDAVGPDALRYFLLREMSFGLDGSYSDEQLLDRYNGDLANELGNVTSRVIALCDTGFAGRTPPPSTRPEAIELRPHAREAHAAWRAAFDDYDFSTRSGRGVEARGGAQSVSPIPRPVVLGEETGRGRSACRRAPRRRRSPAADRGDGLTRDARRRAPRSRRASAHPSPSDLSEFRWGLLPASGRARRSADRCSRASTRRAISRRRMP